MASGVNPVGTTTGLAVVDRAAERDFLVCTGFRFWLHRLPTLSFRAQRVILPGMSLPPAMMTNLFAPIPMAGDRPQFGQLQITYRVDEDMRNYTEVLGWLYGLSRPESFKQYAELPLEPGTGVKSDATLMILDHAKNPRVEVVFRDCVPTYVGDLVFDATTTGLEYVSVEASFAFVAFDVNPVGA